MNTKSPKKKFLGGLKAWHSSEKRHKARYGHLGQLRDGLNTYPKALHPIVRTHPVSGKRALFVNTVFTTHIEGLAKFESDAILKLLYDHIATPEFQCRFRWRANSVAFWDNRCTQHFVLNDFEGERVIRRVTVVGDQVEGSGAPRWKPSLRDGRLSATSRHDRQLYMYLKSKKELA